jgi:hypothetical protein
MLDGIEPCDRELTWMVPATRPADSGTKASRSFGNISRDFIDPAATSITPMPDNGPKGVLKRVSEQYSKNTTAGAPAMSRWVKLASVSVLDA